VNARAGPSHQQQRRKLSIANQTFPEAFTDAKRLSFSPRSTYPANGATYTVRATAIAPWERTVSSARRAKSARRRDRSDQCVRRRDVDHDPTVDHRCAVDHTSHQPRPSTYHLRSSPNSTTTIGVQVEGITRGAPRSARPSSPVLVQHLPLVLRWFVDHAPRSTHRIEWPAPPRLTSCAAPPQRERSAPTTYVPAGHNLTSRPAARPPGGCKGRRDCRTVYARVNPRRSCMMRA